MKHIFFVIDTQSNSGNQQEMIQIDAFNDKLTAENKLVSAAGIGSPKTAIQFDNRMNAGMQSNQSLNQDEFYSGFWIIDCHSEEVEDLGQQASLACNRKVEVRPFLA